ncbi:MAG: hypothetical protein D6729_17980 [Deltaproteobacteria bacterium]|nr:MAG: hypothetical protein D6729_17980 [Deltaproteobacteria bacterium]
MNARSIETVLFSALLLLSACAAGTNGAKDAKEAPAALLPNAHRVSETLVTGGQPSKAQLERLKEEGFTTVISLRTDAEPGAKEGIENAKALGFKVVHIPVAGAKGVTEENARKVAEALAAADGKVVLHCASGNRAGAMVALKAYYVDGKSVEEALRLGRAAGLTHLEEAVRQHLLEAEKARQSSKGAAAGAAETPEDAPAPDATDAAEE